jgi:NADH-quinone oxidoreductase subunit M
MIELSYPLLSILIAIPLLTGLFLLLLPEKHAPFARWFALISSLLSLAFCWPLFTHYDPNVFYTQFVERHQWIPWLKVYYRLGVDGLSIPMIGLTAITQVIVLGATWQLVHKKIVQYLATFMIMQAMMVGVFCAMDALLFYVFWEGVLIPMYLCIGIWGSHNRSYAAIKFFLITFLGSVLLLIALLFLSQTAHSFYIFRFYLLPLSLHTQILIFVAFLLAFAIKIPMWPVHTWLPDAHTEAPAAGSVILAALMLKMGAYGFLRFSLPIIPDACRFFAPLMICLSLIAIVYIGLVALNQKDIKRLIAYSSVAHMGFVTLGLFIIFYLTNSALHPYAILGLEGAMIQMVSHGFSSGALFLAFGLLYERMHTRDLNDFGGVATVMPYFAAFFMVFALSNLGMPGTAGFVGEFMVILATTKAHLGLAATAAITLVIGASYTLLFIKKTLHGPIVHQSIKQLKDVSVAERMPLTLLTIAILALGIYPKPLVHIMHQSATHLEELAMRSHLPKPKSVPPARKKTPASHTKKQPLTKKARSKKN